MHFIRLLLKSSPIQYRILLDDKSGPGDLNPRPQQCYSYLDIFIFKTSCQQQLSFAILMLVYHQERVVLLLPIARDVVGIAPICCIKLIVSEVIHPSVILPSRMVRKAISSRDNFLPLGRMP
jgi:hypothetical protein